MANFLDKAIAAISPEKGYRRAVARTALSVINNGTGYGNYGASHTSRSMRSWHVGGGSAKEDIEDNLETLRKRSRDAYMGIPLAAGAIKTLRTNVVGSGLVPTPQVDADYLHLTEEQADHLQAEISREFSLWADSAACDASGMDNFWRLQTLAFTSFLMNGDVFAAVQFKERGNWPYALQLRLIEADQVCSPDRTDRIFMVVALVVTALAAVRLGYGLVVAKTVYKWIVNAEEKFGSGAGAEKKAHVIAVLRGYTPDWLDWAINERTLDWIVQIVFNFTKKKLEDYMEKKSAETTTVAHFGNVGEDNKNRRE